MICNDCGSEIELTQDLKRCPQCGRRVDYDFAKFVEKNNGYIINGRTITLFHVSGLTPEIRARIENNDLDELILTYNTVWNHKFQFSNSPFFRSKQKKVTFKITIAPQVTCLNFLFAGCTELEEAPYFDLGDIKETMYLFYGCKSLHSVPNYNMLRVKNVTGMFEACTSLRNISSFTTMQATEMSDVFADCTALETVDKIYTNCAINITRIFFNCAKLTSIPELITMRVKDMTESFKGCSSLKNIALVNTSSVVIMMDCFDGCTSLKSLPDLNTKAAENMCGLFRNCRALTKAPTIKTNSVLDLNSINEIYEGCPQNNVVIIKDNTDITDELKKRIAHGTVSEVIMAISPSDECSPFNRMPVTKFTCQIELLGCVDSTAYMFADCENLDTIPELNTQHIQDMTAMFINCKSITTPPTFNLTAARDLNLMFKNCISLKHKMHIPDGLKHVLHETSNTYEGIPQFTTIGKGIGYLKKVFGHQKKE